MTKSHTLLDKYTMPTSMRHSLIEDEMTEHCVIHPGEFIKYFCPTHQTLNCGHCSVLNHESCRQQIISEIAKAFNDGPGYEDIKQALSQLVSDIDTCVSNVEDNINLVEKLSEREITELKEYRDQVNKYFDEREKSLLSIITKMKTMDKMLLDSLKPKCDKLKTQVNEIKPNLEAQEKKPCQLFMEAQKAKGLLEGMQSTLAEINKENSIQMYQFVKDPVSQMMLSTNTGLGTIKEMGTAEAQKDRILNQASSTTQAIGKTETTKSDAETNVRACEDTQAVKTTKKVSSNEPTKGAPMIPSRIQILRNLDKYRHPDLAISDVMMAFSTFSDLRPKEENFVFNDGTIKTLLQLSGTIPIKYDDKEEIRSRQYEFGHLFIDRHNMGPDNTYNIPICICLMDTHPYEPPMVFVKPTTTMCIKPGRYWDINGTICLPYLREWKYPDSDLCGMIQRLTVVFEEEIPVYSILRNTLDAVTRSIECNPEYRHPDLAISDVMMAFSTFSDLRSKEEDFVFNDGTMKALLQLSGTIPIKYDDNTYNIPICICLMDTHPYEPPIVFVKPTTTMCIRPGRYWDINGTICLPYLREWKYPDSDLCGMIQRLTVVFEEYPPVYSILRNNIDAMVQTDFV